MDYLILNKKTFYPDLIEQISQAKKVIVFDAYIWINDRVGLDIARACLDAANRGVKVFIRKDLSASIFEHTPGRKPLFFDEKMLKSKNIRIFDGKNGFLTAKTFNILAYFIYGRKPRPMLDGKNGMAKGIEEHENIFFQNTPLFNHGKLILIDDIAYIGGQCIANDYENWTDYNIKIKDSAVVENIWSKLLNKKDNIKTNNTFFVDNREGSIQESIHYFLKNFIDTSKDELIIEMAYLGRWYVPILKKALKRGVRVTIMTSKETDTNHHTNMWVLSDLLKLKMENLTVLLAKPMVHTKGLATKEKITLGAANFHNACGHFFALNEQNIFSTEQKLVAELFSQFEKDCSQGEKITEVSQLPVWSRISAIFEVFSVYMSTYIFVFNKQRIKSWREEANQILEDVYWQKRTDDDF